MPPKPVARRKPPAAATTPAVSANDDSPAVEAGPSTTNEPPQTSETAPTEPVPPTDETSTLVSSTKPVRIEPLNPRGRGTIARPKFAGRRSQAARLELEREQAEQKAKENFERAKRIAKLARGARGGPGAAGGDRGRGRGRGRGGYVGEQDRIASIASGPFSAGQTSDGSGWGRRSAAASSSSGGVYLGGSGGGPAASRASVRLGASGVKTEDGQGGSGAGGIVSADGGYISSDDEDEGKGDTRKDVDQLIPIDLTPDDDVDDQNFAPLRVPRQAHKERVVGMTVDSAVTVEKTAKELAGESGTTEKRRGKQRAKEVEFISEKERFHGTYSSNSDTETENIKQEPKEDELDLDDIDPVPGGANLDAPSSPESRRKAKAAIKPRTSSVTKAVRPLLQTQEEVREWERQQRDLELLHSELGMLSTSNDQDGDVDMSQSTQLDRRADKVYLFQFPPVLPDLHPIQVKSDPEESQTMPILPIPGGGAAEVPNMLAPTPTAGPSTTTIPPDQTSSNIPPTSNDGQPSLAPGSVGKLRIHKSGKATLDWGGTSLVVSMGTDITFLQDIVTLEMLDVKEGQQASDEIGGVAMGMGQVKGKFVVTPNWDELLS